MMYGFGDSARPANDTINMMEELLIEHITDVVRPFSVRLAPMATESGRLTKQCIQAHRISTNRGKIKVDDFKFALRKDSKKLARIDELLFMKEDIDRARGRKGGLEDYADETALADDTTAGKKAKTKKAKLY